MPERFVAAPAPELTGWHPEAQVYTEMRPEQFLRNLGKLGEPDSTTKQRTVGGGEYDVIEFYVSPTSSANLRERMLAGQEIDPLFIDYDPFQKKIVRHEGRHRALVASQLGIERVPVIVWFYDERGWHDVKNEEGRVYDQSHYIPLEELGEGQINSALARLGAERTYGIHETSQRAARRPYARRDLSVHVSGHRRRA